MPARPGGMHIRAELLLVFLFVLFFGILFLFFVFLFFLDVALFVLLVIEVIGDGIHVHGVRLRDLELRFALRAAQDFALLDFVLIHVNFGATIGAANHGTILRAEFTGRKPGRIATAAEFLSKGR